MEVGVHFPDLARCKADILPDIQVPNQPVAFGIDRSMTLDGNRIQKAGFMKGIDALNTLKESAAMSMRWNIVGI